MRCNGLGIFDFFILYVVIFIAFFSVQFFRAIFVILLRTSIFLYHTCCLNLLALT